MLAVLPQKERDGFAQIPLCPQVRREVILAFLFLKGNIVSSVLPQRERDGFAQMKFIPMSEARSGSLPTMEARRDSRFFVFEMNGCGGSLFSQGMVLDCHEGVVLDSHKRTVLDCH